MRFFYLTAVYLVSPLMLLFWVVRGLRNPAYMDRLGQRFGFGVPRIDQPSLWIHAVSVGEVQAAVPLIRSLMKAYPEKRLVVTTVTPTGAARVRRVFGDDVTHLYVPFETNGAVKRFFDRIQPTLAIIMETEIWPNLYNECGVRGIPLVLASARISPRSVKSYRRMVPLFREALSHGIVIAAQSESDAARFRELGAAPERTFVTGNLKFDIEADQAHYDTGRELRAMLGVRRPIWVAASTHEGEEQQLIEAHQRVRERHADAILVLVPRHPERFDELARYLRDQKVAFVRRTANKPVTDTINVYLCDTMGEVMGFYAASDVAFVGGSLVPIGGHNLLEPAVLGKPVLTGPYNFNSEDIAQRLSASSACVVVQSPEALGQIVADLFADADARQSLGERARDVLDQNRGALSELLGLLEPLITRSPALKSS
ncbi:MAG: lipid IV(A) 3-deoxy-D-manno-octulosonic acid transferase [Pseudomonadota bacterium]